MRNFKLTLAYDGTDYFGWQAQADKVTVQQALEAAVTRITGEEIRLHASGRTDTGVHALGQVVSFRSNTNLKPEVLQKALNAVLPHDIAVRDVCEVPPDFHPRYCAKRKHYRYLIFNGPVRDVFLRHYAWHYKKGRLDADAMHRAARPLAGTHDFASFESSGAKRKTSVRTVFSLEVRRHDGFARGDEGRREGKGERGENCSSFSREPTASASPLSRDPEWSAFAGMPVVDRWPLVANPGDWIIFDIVADGFLYNMVRSILGTLVEVGRGAQSEGWPFEVLQAHDRRRAGPTAPPQGLFLMKVSYAEDT
ncbi:MAG: tRNA pseudouridine(38-40) synthase TruA [Pirellulales bacterium]|nr:tRNA pseudouridine(38-40) synthase TruA [Pirellulales bacterium]